jgi:ATP-dependent DNA helicase DinG
VTDPARSAPANVNGHDRSPLQRTVSGVFSPGGALSRGLKGYEPRDGQRRMAETVAAVIEGGGTLLAEAGTGTGKTLAYLIPAILSGHRVLVSTGTKNLQEQIFFKDLPALQQALGLSFTATLMKGRGNYLCLHRWESYREGADDTTAPAVRLLETGDRMFLPIVEEWLTRTDTGDRAELTALPENVGFWNRVSAEADTCLGSDCPRHSDCFVTRMRQRAAESDVVIVNHHLLCADASVRRGAYGEVIPFCPTLVVDEAHQLEDVATQYFGRSLSAHRVFELVHDGHRLAAAGAGGAPQTIDLVRALARLEDQNRQFFGELAAARAAHFGSSTTEGRLRYTAESLDEVASAGAVLSGSLEDLTGAIAALPATRPQPTSTGAVPVPDVSDGLEDSWSSLQRRAAECRDDLRFLLKATDPDYVYYLESRRGAATPSLHAAPIDVSRLIREALLARVRATVLTSATLAVDGSFSYIESRLGLRSGETLRVASEFDYATQALLYLPRRLPPPRTPRFAEAAAREVIEIVHRSRGRAFVLFTSYSVLRTVQQLVEMSVPYPVLVQGTVPRTELIERFRTTPHAVLLATSSFWQGVDVVGDALSCVIIDKLPFASPGDPVTAARIDAINAAGGDAFAEYQVPLAILTLQQGLGRLIRHRSDRGVLAVLDPRLRTMGYGRRFLDSLPPAPVTHDLDAIGRFFG